MEELLKQVLQNNVLKRALQQIARRNLHSAETVGKTRCWRRLTLEGSIAKRGGSQYRSGRRSAAQITRGGRVARYCGMV